MENQNSGQMDHPDANGAQLMGILSIVFGCGIIGWILAFVARSKAGKVLADAAANPGKYTEASLKKAKTGKTCSTVTFVLMGLSIVFIIIAMATGALAN
jgi:hypothetical protein